MPTWIIMFSIQAIILLGALSLILWFMYHKDDKLDEELKNKLGSKKNKE